MTVLAAAKINLSLEILGRRPDGYHELRSVMQEVTLYDHLDFEPADAFEFRANVGKIDGEQNLVARAARLMMQRYLPKVAYSIVLRKHIPIAAGLGGGSSDAASTLIELGKAWDISAPCDDYAGMAAALGSDVPFFLYGGTALVEGRGERVSPLPDSHAQHLVLVNPRLAVSTARIFADLRESEWSDGRRTLDVASCLERGEAAGFGVNALQPALFRLYPDAERCFRAASALAPGRTIVSGSGPTVVTRFQAPDEAAAAAARLAQMGYWTALVHNRPREGDHPCP